MFLCRWENSPHPYVFFNDDGDSISFLGIHLDRNLNLVAEQTGEVMEESIMGRGLYQGLVGNNVVFNRDFDSKSRKEKLEVLSRVFGVEAVDPDESYELTYDNIMKMLAIHMRFRSNIPVVIMGETGSGKTRLIRFMCDMMRGEHPRAENMLILKTHGGVTAQDIHKKVEEAEKLAAQNYRKGIKQTVLFFDEANTTNAIGTIKTIMCDKMVDGREINLKHGLQFVAAVNPYREHSDEMIKKLEGAGLGYHIKAEESVDKIGSIPLRRLVYRVKEIPASMFPLIFDFGTLDTETEAKYIAQMIRQRVEKGRLPRERVGLLQELLSASQDYMREQKDECSFVSLRDVERYEELISHFVVLL